MLERAAVNARILHRCHCLNNNEANNTLTIKQSLEKLVHYLVIFYFYYKYLQERYLQGRYKVTTLRLNVRRGIAGILGIDKESAHSAERNKLEKRVKCRCYI